jgi:flagellar hook-basal body complex protein FliE
MVDKVTSHANIAAMLQTLKAAQAQASAGAPEPAVPQAMPGAARPSFTDYVRDAVTDVNATQLRAREAQAAYERGEAPLTEVVLGMQKSSLAFEATLQVRNKVMKAYEDIINMPV